MLGALVFGMDLLLYGPQTWKHQWAAALFLFFFSFFWAASAEINKQKMASWHLEVCGPYGI
jgi:hypothetical protein